MLLNRAVKITGEEDIFQGDSLLQIKSGNLWQNVGHYEHLGYIGGRPGTYKSTMLQYIAAAGTPGFEPLGFRLNLNGQRAVWFDGEQPQDIVVSSVRRYKELSGKNSLDYLEVHSLNGIQKAEKRREELFRFFREELDKPSRRGTTGIIFIDGLANFIRAINSFDEAEDFMDKLAISAKRLKCLILVLCHLATTQDGGTKLFGAGGTKLDQLASWGLHMTAQEKYLIMSMTKSRYGLIAPKYLERRREDNTLHELGYFPY